MASRQRYIDILSRFSQEIQCSRTISGKSRKGEGMDQEWFNNMVRKLDTNLMARKASPVTEETLRDMIKFVSDFKDNPLALHLALLLSLLGREPPNAMKIYQLGGLTLAAAMLQEEDTVLRRNCMAMIATISGHSDHLEDIQKEVSKDSVLTQVIRACSFINNTAEPSSDQNGILANACALCMNVVTEKEFERMIQHLKRFEVMPLLLYCLTKSKENYVLNKALHLASVFASDAELRGLFLENGVIEQIIDIIQNENSPDFVLGPAIFCISKYGVDEKLAQRIVSKDELLRRLVNIFKLCDPERNGERGLFGRDPKKDRPSQESKRVNQRLGFTVCTALSNLLSGATDKTVQEMDNLGLVELLISMLNIKNAEDPHILASRGLSNMFAKVSNEYAPVLFSKVLEQKCLSRFTELASARKEKPDSIFFSILRAINVFCQSVQEKGSEDNISQVKAVVEKNDDLKQLMMIIAEVEKANNTEDGSKAPFKTILILVMILFLFLLFIPVVFKMLKSSD